MLLILICFFALTTIGLSVGQDAVCPRGWSYYAGSCYLPVKSNVSPLDARNECLGRKADLVSIASEAEDFFVKGLIAQLDPSRTGLFNRYTIGMTLKRDANGAIEKAEWYDNTPVVFGNPVGTPAGTHPWGTGAAWQGVPEPKASRIGANCVSLIRAQRSGGDWSANPCQGIAGGYVCEFALQQGAKGAGAAADTQDTTPQIACSNGYIAFGPNCYKVFNSQVATAATGELACQADGGHLATIANDQENLFVQGMINHLNPGHLGKNHQFRYFIGMQLQRDAIGEITSVQWKNGDPVVYGDPTAQGFLPGTPPWAGPKAFDGEAEPKTPRDASIVFIGKNSLTGGKWAAGPPTLTGGYVCQLKGDAIKNAANDQQEVKKKKI